MKNPFPTKTKVKTAKRAGVILVALFLFMIFLAFNILRLDLFLYEYYKAKAQSEITTTSILKADRGKIYDANMNLLASTKTTWRVFVSTREVKKRSSEDGRDYAEIISGGVASIFNLDSASLYKKIKNTSTLDVTLVKKASEDEYARLLAFITENKLEDVLLTEAQSERYYPEGTLAAHVLGFAGSDGVGLYGLEYEYNSTLTGKNGYYLYAKDANGNALPGEYVSYVEASDGLSIVTTLDSYVQGALESELAKIAVNHDVSGRVSGIVMNTETGAILAMATSSPFDPNDPFTLDPRSRLLLEESGLVEGTDEYSAYKTALLQKSWSNPTVNEPYEPGSTFKIITVASALDSGAASINDHFSCPGFLQVGGWRIKCHKTTGHGSGFTLGYGLQMSCNPTMMTVASRIGADRFYDYVKEFGYLEDTGIDLPGEAGTIFHDKSAIGTTELATSSFGQRFKVTMINHLTAIAAVANGGRLVTPYLVERVLDSEGRIVSEHEVEYKRTVISEEVSKILSDVLEEGVSGNGGAKNAYVDGYKVAAKTGTSEKFDVLDENGRSYLRIGSTVAYAPANEGGIAVIIVVDEPQCQVKYGSQVAAPYVSSLLTGVLPYLEYESTKKPDSFTLDSYVGNSLALTTDALKNAGVKYEVIGNGESVVAQSPSPLVTIEKSVSVVYLYTDTQEIESVSVPSVVGMTLLEANRLLTNAGLNLRIRGAVGAGRDKLLYVVSQSLPPDEQARRGSVIEIYVAAKEIND